MPQLRGNEPILGLNIVAYTKQGICNGMLAITECVSPLVLVGGRGFDSPCLHYILYN
jgi:hypothetical protein